MYECVHVCMHACMRVCVHACMYLSMRVYIDTPYTHMYTLGMFIQAQTSASHHMLESFMPAPWFASARRRRRRHVSSSARGCRCAADRRSQGFLCHSPDAVISLGFFWFFE